MIVTKRALPRRTFLKGAGAAIGLPLLDAMVPAFAADAPKAKRIGFVWDYMFKGDQMFSLMQPGLAERYPGASFVPHSTFGNVHGHDEREVLAALPKVLRAEKVDANTHGRRHNS